jgi:hypothetical protein
MKKTFLTTTGISALPTGAKVFLGVTAFLGIVRMAEFIFYGMVLYNLLGALGWWALAFGAYRNGFVPKEEQSKSAKVATIIGVGLLAAAFAMKVFK